MPRKTHPEKEGNRRSTRPENRTPRPKPKIDFTIDAIDYKNTTLLRQFVTDEESQPRIALFQRLPPVAEFDCFQGYQN